MTMDLAKFKNFKDSITSMDNDSTFSVKMFDSGAYFQITNSNGLIHDIGFVALRDAFQTLKENYQEVSHYIEWCNQNPSSVDNRNFENEKINFNTIVNDLTIKKIIPLIADHWDYIEKPLRVISDHYFPNTRIFVVGKEQTKLLFNAISRLIYCANNISTKGISFDNQCPFSLQNVEITLDTLNQILDFYDVGSKSVITLQASVAMPGVNIIYYGAPGTGKSHTIDDEVKEKDPVRTVFHADTTNSDFMGCLKPKMNGGVIVYEFRPGPFTIAVCNAIKDPDQHHWLIIEEINRAPAAAVFGEIFQLLDRVGGTGCSRYSITLSDLDMKAYVENETGITLVQGKLSLPGNLTLLATMNSSDQAVMPLDTAFKRRWQFRYIPLDFNVAYMSRGNPCAVGNLQITDRTGSEIEVSWKNFATTINTILTEQDIPEDRHLGPFFLSEEEMKSNPKEALTGKLFMYLWDDVLRHGMKDTVFDSEIKTYGQLTRRYNKNEKIFSDGFYNVLESGQAVTKPQLREVAEDSPVYKPVE